MWSIMPQLSGLATTVLDFTNDLSLLIVGLISLMWLSAGMIVVITVQHYLSRRAKPVEKAVSTPVDHRDAA
jgi:ABC-type nickel/cobalt efflux system permease component RcnA